LHKQLGVSQQIGLSELLSLERMAEILRHLQEQADVVLIDVAPIDRADYYRCMTITIYF
jgi:hypothetical protein